MIKEEKLGLNDYHRQTSRYNITRTVWYWHSFTSTKRIQKA